MYLEDLSYFFSMYACMQIDIQTYIALHCITFICIYVYIYTYTYICTHTHKCALYACCSRIVLEPKEDRKLSYSTLLD